MSDVHVYSQCPFCKKENIDVEHLAACALQDAQALNAKSQQPIPDLPGLVLKIEKLKILSTVYEQSSPDVLYRLWCCQECYTYGEGEVPNCCPECKSFCTSPMRMFLDAHASS